MSSEIIPNKCQYWSTDTINNPTEPGTCSHWDSSIPICSYNGAAGEYADFYPWCNLLGTKTNCSKYTSTDGLQAICILPDPYRRAIIPSRFTGKEWVTLPITGPDGDVTVAGNYDNITGYNDGQCDEHGTDGECSGYSPYNLGFSTIQPDDKDGSLEYDYESEPTIASDLTFRVPLNYVIFNTRAKFSKCYWWGGPIEEFVTSSDDGSIDVISFRCIHYDTGYTQRFSTHKYKEEYATYIAPCNGCKPECRYYTGVCWQYCIDEKMKQGDKVLAEQILELRWHLRRNNWTAQKFINSFDDPIIFAWQGTLLTDNYHYNIDAIKTEIDNFDTFNIKKSTLRLTEGTPDNKLSKNYPSLVREIKALPLRPIVKNKFFELDGELVFEAGSLNDDSILLFGDTFYALPIYAINLSDPDLEFLANDLRFLDYPRVSGDLNDGTAEFGISENWCENMVDVRSHYDSTEDFEELFYTKFETIIDRLLKYYPEKITETEIGSDNRMFYIDVPTVWGENKIMLLDKGTGTWDFTLFKFTKYLCGGLIAQTSYTLEGDEGKTIDYLPDYARDFCAYENNNGSITFNFASYVNEKGKSSEVYHVYNDYFTDLLPVNILDVGASNTYETGYQLYKIKIDLSDDQITIDNVRFFGNAGYAMVDIPDNNILNSVFRDWEISGSFYLYVTTKEGEEKIIEMSVHEKCTNRLESNQMIIKPNDIQDFSAPCEAVLEFDDGIYYYKKYSFGELPEDDYELIAEESISENAIVNYKDGVELIDVGFDTYELRKFGADTLLISVVYKGSITGRIKGLTRTKMLVWVRQPFCRDVEISYNWRADYKVLHLQPAYYIYGRTYYDEETNHVVGSHVPECGDHDLGFFNTKGPMWYPYDTCADFEYYPTQQLTSRATGVFGRVMEVFDNTGDDAPSHGAWDMRMLGPQEWYGDIDDVRSTLYTCRTDWSYVNRHKITENIFNGYGRYRCGLDTEAKELATRNGGILPKFGNPSRDFLRSYLSTDNVYYYVSSSDGFIRRRKWMPINHFYTKSDVFQDVSDSVFKLYTLDTSSPYVNSMGLFLATIMEGVTIGEQVDVDTYGVPKRYNFDDIFWTHDSNFSIAYPYPTTVYFSGPDTMRFSWYTFNDYAEGSDKSIQWVWQEPWQSVIRYTPSTETLIGEDIMACDSTTVGETSGELGNESADSGIDEFVTSRPYDYNDAENIEGRLDFFTIVYPDYVYDASIKEHRLIMEEGTYTLHFTAPSRNDDGEYDDKKFYLQIDDGPKRAFDIDGTWDPDDVDNLYYNLYTTCTQSPWVTSVNLFAEGYTNVSTVVAEAEERMISTYDDMGSEIKTYYQRGLGISLLPDDFSYLPRQKVLLVPEALDMSMSKVPSFIQDAESVYNNIEAGELFPMTQYCIECGYNCTDETVDFVFDFNSKKAVDRIIFICKFGSEEIEEDEDGNPTKWRFYHIPSLTIAHSDLGLIYDTVWSSYGGMTLSSKEYHNVSEKNIIVDYNLSGTDILEPHTKWRVRLRLKPTATEIGNTDDLSEYYSANEHVVFFKCIYIYDTSFVDAEEEIEVFERKYNISYGNHGDFPPHGYNDSGSLLYPPLSERSSLYQRDTIAGVFGLAGSSGELTCMNKFRGRIMKETHADREGLENNELSAMEQEQKKIYDEIAINSGDTSFTLTSTIPPGLTEKLREANSYPPERWTCDFKNTIILPLSQVEQQESYSACGERWDWDFSDYGWHRDRCLYYEVFKYSYVSACDDNVLGDTMESLELYFAGSVGTYLINPMIAVFPTSGFATPVFRTIPVTAFTNPGTIDAY